MTIYEFIKKNYLRLSKGQRKVAQFILDQPQTIVSNVASEVGRLAGVSESTVIRFCYAIDLGGYNELQAKLEEYLTLLNVTTSPKIEKAVTSDSVKTGMLNQIKYVSKVIEKLDSKQVTHTLEILNEAETTYVVGFNENKKYASFFNYNCEAFNQECTLIEQDEMAILQAIVSFKKGSALIVFSERELNEEAEAILEEAIQKEMKVILIHMQAKHSQAKKCDAHLAIDSNETKSAASYSVILSLLEVLDKMDTQKLQVMTS